MGILDIVLLSLALAMDAFAVSVCKGLAIPRVTWRSPLLCALWFGAFQALMPLAGFWLGSRFEAVVHAYAPWIAFALLTLIGINMIRESRAEEDEKVSAALDVRTMFPLALATSIDALAVGITFAVVPPALCSASPSINTLQAALMIGVITGLLAASGLLIGKRCGTRFQARAEMAGGLILILIGFKTLLF